jgi:hypothetical protein
MLVRFKRQGNLSKHLETIGTEPDVKKSGISGFLLPGWSNRKAFIFVGSGLIRSAFRCGSCQAMSDEIGPKRWLVLPCSQKLSLMYPTMHVIPRPPRGTFKSVAASKFGTSSIATNTQLNAVDRRRRARSKTAFF